jgi:hypothetical protein
MTTKPSPMTRRRFLTRSSKAASTIAVANLMMLPDRARSGPPPRSANDKLNIAFIGVAGRGGNNLGEILQTEDVNVAALCDVDETNLDKVGAKFPAAKRYRDYRKLVISIPDHNHAPAAMMALKLGRHVYCDKPSIAFRMESRSIGKRYQHCSIAAGTHCEELLYALNQLFSIQPEGFVDWMRAKMPDGQHAFDKGAIEADLEFLVDCFPKWSAPR